MLPPILPRPMRPSCMADPFDERPTTGPAGEFETGVRAEQGRAELRLGRHCGLRGQATATNRIREGRGPGGSAGETDRHEDVAVALVRVAVGLRLTGQNGGSARLG